MKMKNLIKGKSGIWEMCIGLEIHAQILAKSKLFSNGSAKKLQHNPPNSRVTFVDAALPGTLPVLNEECVNQAIRTGLALGSDIQKRSVFERKHYFYCDLPQGYQITQQRAPVATGGAITIRVNGEEEKKQVTVNRIQLEQDSGKSTHDILPDSTLVDLNRAGSGLMEIVLEPEIRSSEEAGEVLRKLQQLLKHLGTCDGQMEDGSMRCDLNVSVRRVNAGGEKTPYGERVEIKNMNSVRNMMHAADYEAQRQIDLLEAGEELHKETRTYDAISGRTRRMRTKEGAKDYRFFPEPDLPPLILSSERIQHISDNLPELPDALQQRLCSSYGLTLYESNVLMQDPRAVEFFEKVAAEPSRPHKLVANWVMNDLFGLLKATNTPISLSPVSPARLGELLDLIQDKTISGKIAKEAIEVMYYEDKRSPKEIVKDRNWAQITDREHIKQVCQEIIADEAHAKPLQIYKGGNKRLFGYFVGEVMKKFEGKVNPEIANAVLRQVLDKA